MPINEIKSLPCRAMIPCECINCKKTFLKNKRTVLELINKKLDLGDYCSFKCQSAYLNRDKVNYTNCKVCNKPLRRTNSELKKTKFSFCGHSCAAKYSNTHKTHGTRRSKLEVWLETQLKTIYPKIDFLFNNVDIINSELDIYIPSLKLAFELNGIFHYEPIYGKERLEKIQNNDGRKFQACLEHKIELCIIDTTGLKYFKEVNAKKYLDIICNVINGRS